MSLIQKLTKLFSNTPTKAVGKYQTFTYFIPSPPKRKNGYREKQFDSIFYEFINRGYEVISLKTVASNSESQPGFWIVCLVRALKKNVAPLDLDCFDPTDTIEGLYPLE